MSDTAPNSEPTTVPETTSIFEWKAPKDKAPKGAAQSSTGQRGRPNKHNQRKEKLLTIMSTVGSAVAMFEQFDGFMILSKAEEVAEATATLADEVPAVAKALDGMSTGGAYGAFFLSILSMVLPILAHHNILPPFVAAAFVPQEQSAA